MVSLRLGRKLDAEKIQTGHDVYFECDIKSNPSPLRLEWRHNGKLLSPDISGGVVMSGQSLVLQKVKKEAVGEYVCVAHNTEGVGESNPVRLKIMCK